MSDSSNCAVTLCAAGHAQALVEKRRRLASIAVKDARFAASLRFREEAEAAARAATAEAAAPRTGAVWRHLRRAAAEAFS